MTNDVMERKRWDKKLTSEVYEIEDNQVDSAMLQEEGFGSSNDQFVSEVQSVTDKTGGK